MIGKCCSNYERKGKVRSESYYSFNLVVSFKSVTLSNISMKYCKLPYHFMIQLLAGIIISFTSRYIFQINFIANKPFDMILITYNESCKKKNDDIKSTYTTPVQIMVQQIFIEKRTRPPLSVCLQNLLS